MEMKRAVRQLDEILRGERTRGISLKSAKLDIGTRGLAMVIGMLAVSYGLCMGSFSMARAMEIGTSEALTRGLLQTTASMIKMPLLFLSTLFITFPSLYVFSALVGSSLKVQDVLRLLVASLAVNLAVLASLGPIVAFFSVSTPSYGFVLLLNVFCCALAGVLGLSFLLQTLHRINQSPDEESNAASVVTLDLGAESPANHSSAVLEPGPLTFPKKTVLGPHVKQVFLIWLLVFGVVGAQMSWVLRPFIGNPSKDFAWLRPRDSNFFEAVWLTFQGLFS